LIIYEKIVTKMLSSLISWNIELDSCFAHDICGKHGRCVNNLVGFKCSCYFYMDGLNCEQSK
jgi:hypothetical protein